ncbi:11759_t:CDS:2 [Ambispora leptoticha]|uniref:11759_t:CDS:1 n=1 Tax=Ambispora leptoticha TaxID=144679 RepID=A0A9N8YQ72_9GLOM|nr:11759_t:CDS:2 [Ambispora leptoticha]
MSGRALRRRRAINPQISTASNALYVGYVEDDESVEAIMKKFEELERIQEEIAATKPEEPVGNVLEEIASSSQIHESKALTEEQLIEVFKRTSSFTVKSATFAPNIDDVQDLEYWRIEMEDGNTAEFEEEDDYLAVDDDFWDEEFGNKKKRARKNEKSSSERRRRCLDRESIIQRYKLMQVEDRNGNFFMVKKKVSNIDPSLPTYVRIPSLPIPRSWAHSIRKNLNVVHEENTSRYLEKDVLSMDLTTLGKNFQAVYIDPPLLLPEESPSPGKITMNELRQLEIPKILLKGFLFIWAEKEYLPDILQMAESWNFRYVENFCWIKKNINNQFAKLPSRYFNKSKLSLLVFRKEGDIEIRHQRNPDCVFDFIKPCSEGMLTEQKPPIIYDVIETMLPGAVYSDQNKKPDRLLELWGKKGSRRKGWTTVVQVI